LDVSSDRDFVAEFLFVLSMIGIHLSGWAEEWVIWSTTEFNFLELPDAFCTGSSIMPHKKNPDTLELTRGKVGRVIGCLQQVLVLLKGLPLAYNRDLQEDKSALFDGYDTIKGCLGIAAPLIEQTKLRRGVIAARIHDGFLDATTLMEALISVGVPMRSAHELVGELVRACEQRHCRLAELTEEEFHKILGPHCGHSASIREKLGVDAALASFKSYGSTAPREVAHQVAEWCHRLKLDSSGK
jgi:argininosuccinate lyase